MKKLRLVWISKNNQTKLLLYLKSILDNCKRGLFWILNTNSCDMHLPWPQSFLKKFLFWIAHKVVKSVLFVVYIKKVDMNNCHSSIKWERYFSQCTPYQIFDISVATPGAHSKIYNLLFNTFSQLVILREHYFVNGAVFLWGYSKY